jgi:hypothetical protein
MCATRRKALQAYAKDARDTALFEKATRYFTEAETRAGELLEGMALRGERKTRKTANPSGKAAATHLPAGKMGEPVELADLGITYKQCMTWQQLARMARENPQKREAHVDKTITRVIAVIDPDKPTAEQRATLEAENTKLKAQPVEVPKGRFSCIDPPWDMRGTGRCYNRLRLESQHRPPG